MSLVTASETDLEQTESRFVNRGRCGVQVALLSLFYVNRSLFGILAP